MTERRALAVIGLLSAAVILAVAWLLLGPRSAAGGGSRVGGLPPLNAFLNGTSAVLLSV